MATLDTVARILRALPETAETSSATGLRWWVVKRKTIAWERPVKMAMLSADPDVFFTTPHFDGHPSVLIPLARIDAPTLRAVLLDAWLGRAPKRLASEYLA